MDPAVTGQSEPGVRFPPDPIEITRGPVLPGDDEQRRAWTTGLFREGGNPIHAVEGLRHHVMNGEDRPPGGDVGGGGHAPRPDAA
jgi:hypothetical protein